MKFVFTLLTIITLSLVNPPRAHAIIILPAVILIPLAQLVAVIVAAFGIPVVSIGVFVKTVSKNYKLAFLISSVIMLLVFIVAVVVLRAKYPNNPWF